METSITQKNLQTGLSLKTLKGVFKNNAPNRTPLPENSNAWKEKDAIPAYWCKNGGLASVRKQDGKRMSYLNRRVEGFKPKPKQKNEQVLMLPTLKKSIQPPVDEPYLNMVGSN